MIKLDVSKLLSLSPIKARQLLREQKLLLLLHDKQILKSRYFVLFIITLISSSTIGIVYNVQKLLKTLRNRNNIVVKRTKSSLKLGNGSREIYVPYKGNKTIKITIPSLNHDKYQSDALQFKSLVSSLEDRSSVLNSAFIQKMYLIWKLILIPKILDTNTSLLFLQIFFLISRTYLSLLVTKLDGTIVKDLIGLNGKKFMRDLVYWFLLAFPASFTNASIKFLTKKLALNFRTNLIRYIHDIYLDKMMVYYKLQFKDLKNIDQYITEDVKKFSLSLTSLFSSIGKPFMDLIFFSFYLRDNLGTFGIIGIFINYFITGYFLKNRSPNFSKLLKQKTHLEGIFYNNNLSLINNCEEISFYKGIHLEKIKIVSIFERLMNQLKKEYKIKFLYQFYEDYVLKYTWSALGYLFAAIPIFFNYGGSANNENKNMKQFIINKRLMLSLADAGSRLMFSIKDLSRLSGYTDRIFTLLINLHEVHSKDFAYGSSVDSIKGITQTHYQGLRFEGVPVVVPPDTTLISNLNFTLSQGSNLLVLGKNGIGKTAIMRLISSIWPVYEGLLSRPADADIMFVSQKSYFLNVGNLRDQIIYPLNYSQMLAKGFTDENLIMILEEVGLGYLLKRFNGDLNYSPSEESQGNNPWFNLLSGGERQKMVIARILFHNKSFIILDESTNAISFDAEDYLYELLIKKKFTVITLSHRPLLIKYHDYVLELKEDNQYEFNYVKNSYNRSTNNSELYLNSISREIDSIEKKLLEKSYLVKRQNELSLLLENAVVTESSHSFNDIAEAEEPNSSGDEDNDLQIEINTNRFRQKIDNAEIDVSIND